MYISGFLDNFHVQCFKSGNLLKKNNNQEKEKEMRKVFCYQKRAVMSKSYQTYEGKNVHLKGIAKKKIKTNQKPKKNPQKSKNKKHYTKQEKKTKKNKKEKISFNLKRNILLPSKIQRH